jgi:hypothetical protein
MSRSDPGTTTTCTGTRPCWLDSQEKELDVEAAISSDVIFAAVAMDPSMWPVVGPFMAMMAPPTALKAVEDKARVVLRTGWRPAYADGPDAGQLAELVR